MKSSQEKIILDKNLWIRTTGHLNKQCNIIGAAFCNIVIFPNGFEPLPPFLDNLEELF